ncbi:hypothetical protein [Streptomyces sp. NPDC017988]|uniref:hypothetical protein n=1 Tax=Streptomyces sp. NPDC017988 TaxID=3365025 RepID=UPI003795AAB1
MTNTPLPAPPGPRQAVWRDGSVHRAAWPDACALREYAGDAAVLTTAAGRIAAVQLRDARGELKVEVTL